MTAERREAASPDLAGSPENPATVSQQTATGGPAVPAPLGPAATPPPAFGRYQVRRALGEGGFGAVYLGHDSQLDRPVALKVLRAGSGPAPGAEDLAQQEARRLAQLRHPGIVAVHDVGVQEGRVYIVSDYLDGPDLGRWLRGNRPTWVEAARITALVADALAHAHARLIVHRDVKPANIILTADSAPVLVDFGLALGEAQAGGHEKGAVSGTPWYMSPEQAAGTAHRIDGRTDIYSLGIVLYEMLTGRVPFRGTNPLELLRQVRDDEPQPPRQLVREIPPELEKACLKALAKRQQDRYTTAADFADDLRRVLPPATQTLVSQPPIEAPLAEPRATSPASPRPQAVTPPSSRRRAREAERRQVTVLVCGSDLFECEAYLELEAEDQASVLRTFQQTCEEAVRRFDGAIVQCNEQGLLVCFGYPVAYEDGARRAARTGLDLLKDLKILGEQLRRKHKLELNPWIGLHTGPAVVEAKEEAVSLVGEARNVAIRLEDVAAAGQLLCTEVTYRLFRHQFQCASLGHRKIKGVAQPVELFRVEGASETRSPVEAAEPAGLTPLTGRDHEVSLLKDRWEQAQEGMGQVVLLIGEPGLGKSRLVHTMKQHVLGQMVEGEMDAPVIEWRCSPHYQNTGLHPAIDFYERALRFRPEEPPQERFDRMLQRLEQYGLVRPETVPLWAALLSLPTPDRFPPLSLSPVRQREETFRAMLEWLHTRAARKPILFIVEDLHWVDPSTLEFLGQFLAEGLHDSILTVLTFRPEFKTPWPAVAHQTSLALNRLTRRQVGDLIRKKTGGTVPEAVVEQIYDRAGGVPLFAEEFTKMVQESGVLDQTGAGAPGARALPAREIPNTLQDLVMARLDRMEGERDMAQLAAVLGREFSYELLAAVATVDDATLQTELTKLVRAEILYPKGRPPQCTYIFKHALLEDALYNALVKGKRQQFHRRIAEALEARFPQTVETQPEVLARHCTEAGLAERAVGYWLKAGLRSWERFANVEAIGHLNKGLELLATLAETPERDARELQLLTPLISASRAARGYAGAEVEQASRRARALGERISEPAHVFASMWGNWSFAAVRGEHRSAMEMAAEALAFAEGQDDPGLIMEALYMSGIIRGFRADFTGSRSDLERGLTRYEDRDRVKSWLARTGQDSGVACRGNLAAALWWLGFPDQALNMARAGCELARRIDHPNSIAYSLYCLNWVNQYCRLGNELLTSSERQVAVCAANEFTFWHSSGLIYQGEAIFLQGRQQEGISVLLKGLDAWRAAGSQMFVPYYLSMLGGAYMQAGRFEDARRTLDEALALVEDNDERFQEAELHRQKGELLLAESHDQAGAEACFRQAIQTARAQQGRGWELRATMSLARLWQTQGRRDDARAALAAVQATYTEGFTTPDLVDTKALLETLV